MAETPTVPLSHALVSGTAGHPPFLRDSAGTPSGTPSLKALAKLVIERDSKWDTERDTVSHQPSENRGDSGTVQGSKFLASKTGAVPHDGSAPLKAAVDAEPVRATVPLSHALASGTAGHRAVDLDALEGRAAIIEYGAGVPRDWAEGFAALSTMPRPDGFMPERWRRIIDAAGHFIDHWAVLAAQCGWSALDVFGCNDTRPDARLDAMGLVLLLDSNQVVAIDEKGADLLTANGASLRFYRRPAPAGTVALWDLVRRDAGAA